MFTTDCHPLPVPDTNYEKARHQSLEGHVGIGRFQALERDIERARRLSPEGHVERARRQSLEDHVERARYQSLEGNLVIDVCITCRKTIMSI